MFISYESNDEVLSIISTNIFKEKKPNRVVKLTIVQPRYLGNLEDNAVLEKNLEILE